MKKELSPAAHAVLQELRVSEQFRAAMKELRQISLPVIPAYKPGHSQEETFSLLERIKFESGRKEGFDLLYLHLIGDRE